jgi:hypothetical protein
MAGKREEEREREGEGFDGRAPVYWTLAILPASRRRVGDASMIFSSSS